MTLAVIRNRRMVSPPTAPNDNPDFNPDFGSTFAPEGPDRPNRRSLLWRRMGAWAVEVALIAASGGLPFAIGQAARTALEGPPVPLNPVLASVEDAAAKTFAIPPHLRPTAVAPMTNLFWSGALVLPVALGGLQLFLLATTGKTSPKAWFGLQLTDEQGRAPGLGRVLLREGVGRWGLPLGTAYGVWRASGAYPDLSILLGLAVVGLAVESGAALLDPQRRPWRDRLAKTRVVDLRDPEGWVEPGMAAMEPGPIAPATMGRSILVNGRSGSGSLTERSAARLTLNHPNGPETTNLILSPIGARGLWAWVRQNPGTAIVVVGSLGLVLVLGTFAATQIYVQDQADRRAAQAQKQELLLDLVAKYSQNAPDQRRGSVLALGAVQDPNPEIVLLLNLLGQEESPQLIEALQQSITSAGPAALPYLQRLNQTLKTDADSLAAGPNTGEATRAALRLRATQRAIAKLLRLRSGADGSIDLSRVDLGQSNSPNAQFSLVLDRADLSGLKLRSAVLTGANLRGSVFRSAGPDGRWNTFDDALTDLSGADLRGADLTSASLITGQLERTSLVGAALNGTNLTSARLIGANLSQAKLLGANLEAANLDGASLTGADLGDAKLNQASLHGAKLGQARAVGASLAQADLTEASWRGGDLSTADLNRANLRNADLSATRLIGANLQGAQLQSAQLQGTDFSQADLRGALFEGANLKGAIFAPTNAAPAGGFVGRTDSEKPSALVKGADFSQAKNLDPRQLAYLCTQGAIHPQCPQ